MKFLTSVTMFLISSTDLSPIILLNISLSVSFSFLQFARYYGLFIARQQQPSLYYFHFLTPAENPCGRHEIGLIRLIGLTGLKNLISPVSPMSLISPIHSPDAFPIRLAATSLQMAPRRAGS